MSSQFHAPIFLGYLAQKFHANQSEHLTLKIKIWHFCISYKTHICIYVFMVNMIINFIRNLH